MVRSTCVLDVGRMLPQQTETTVGTGRPRQLCLRQSYLAPLGLATPIPPDGAGPSDGAVVSPSLSAQCCGVWGQRGFSTKVSAIRAVWVEGPGEPTLGVGLGLLCGDGRGAAWVVKVRT